MRVRTGRGVGGSPLGRGAPATSGWLSRLRLSSEQPSPTTGAVGSDTGVRPVVKGTFPDEETSTAPGADGDSVSIDGISPWMWTGYVSGVVGPVVSTASVSTAVCVGGGSVRGPRVSGCSRAALGALRARTPASRPVLPEERIWVGRPKERGQSPPLCCFWNEGSELRKGAGPCRDLGRTDSGQREPGELAVTGRVSRG